MTRDLDALEDLFELAFERTGSVRQALRAVLEADAAGRTDAELHAEIGRRGPARGSCAWCSRRTKAGKPASAPPVDDIARRRAATSPAAIVAEVAARHGFTVEHLQGPRRDAQICRARFEAYWLLRDRNYSLPQIAAATGRKNHDTVTRGLRRFEAAKAVAS